MARVYSRADDRLLAREESFKFDYMLRVKQRKGIALRASLDGTDESVP